VYCNARLEDERACLLILMAAKSFGDKELIAVSDGYRESAKSWKELLLDLQSRGLVIAPALAVCDGALGFQAAAAEIWPKTSIQRCWFHKSGNLLDKLPQILQAKAKGNGTRKATLAMVYKLGREAEKGWRKLGVFKLLPLVVAGKIFVNGEQVDDAAA
jgi:transposase-like protein